MIDVRQRDSLVVASSNDCNESGTIAAAVRVCVGAPHVAPPDQCSANQQQFAPLEPGAVRSIDGDGPGGCRYCDGEAVLLNFTKKERKWPPRRGLQDCVRPPPAPCATQTIFPVRKLTDLEGNLSRHFLLP